MTPPELRPLAPGWQEATHPSTGRTYWFNASLSKSTWNREDAEVGSSQSQAQTQTQTQPQQITTPRSSPQTEEKSATQTQSQNTPQDQVKEKSRPQISRQTSSTIEPIKEVAKTSNVEKPQTSESRQGFTRTTSTRYGI